MAGSPSLNPPAVVPLAGGWAKGRQRTSRKNPDTLLLRPAAEAGWELWATSPGLPRETGRFESIPDLAQKNLQTVALPAQHTLVFSRWLQTSDEVLLPAMVDVILERQGLSPREEGGKSFSFTVVLREENRTLVAIRLLTSHIPEALCRAQVERFEIAADLQPLVRDGLTLWRESGHLVAAFSRAGELVHLQSFHENLLNETIAIELFCTRLQLETEEIISADFVFLTLGDFRAEEKIILAESFGADPESGASGSPRLPGPVSKLTPPLVEIERQKIRLRKRLERIFLVAASTYAFVLLCFFVNVAWLAQKNRTQRRKIVANQPTVAAIRSAESHWKAMQGAINPRIYPVEVLFQSAALLPDDGVRFTLFEGNANRFTIRGEANSQAAAFKLAEAIKAKPELDYFDWEMPKPTVLANDKAEFQIQGNPPDA